MALHFVSHSIVKRLIQIYSELKIRRFIPINPAVYGQDSDGLFMNQVKPGVLIQNILDWSVIESRCNQNNFNVTTIEKIQLLYNNFLMPDQSFSALSVRKLIGCADSTARSLISKLKDMELLIPVQGKEKGVYRFKKNIEL